MEGKPTVFNQTESRSSRARATARSSARWRRASRLPIERKRFLFLGWRLSLSFLVLAMFFTLQGKKALAPGKKTVVRVCAPSPEKPRVTSVVDRYLPRAQYRGACRSTVAGMTAGDILVVNRHLPLARKGRGACRCTVTGLTAGDN